MIDSVRDKLLLACVKGRWDPKALEEARQIVHENDVDWDDFWAQALKHSVAPLIYHTLRDDDTILSAWLKEKLRGVYYQSAIRNTLLYQELGEIVHAFNEAGVPVILLKGAALAQEVYGNIALRPMGDMDVLVRKEDWSGVERLLVERGFQATPAHPDFGGHSVFHADGLIRIRVEVHSHILGPMYYRRTIPQEWLWQDPVELTIGDASALGLTPEAAIIHSCLHLFQHDSSVLGWACDIVEVSRRRDIDWDSVARRAIQFKIVLPVRLVLQEVRELLNLPIPDHVLRQMFIHRTGFLERMAYQFCLSPAHSPASITFFSFFAVEGLAAKFQFLSSWLFPDRDRMMARYQIRRRRLVPLYYPYMIGKAVLDSFKALARSRR